MDKNKELIINKEIELLEIKIKSIDKEIKSFKGCSKKLILDEITHCECGVHVSLCPLCEGKYRSIINKKIELQNKLIFFLKEWKLSEEGEQ